MDIIFSEIALKQLKRFKRINQDDIIDFVDFLLADENFQKSLKQAIDEGSMKDALLNSFYVPEVDITISTEIKPDQATIEVLTIKRGNHMNI